jgi:hypothetical protein
MRDKTALLAVYLLQSHNRVTLITSQSKDGAARLAGDYKNIIEVRAIDKSPALNLFWNKLFSASNEEGAADLLRAVDYILHAITQAVSFINQRGRISIQLSISLLKNDKKRESLLYWDSGDLRRDERGLKMTVFN